AGIPGPLPPVRLVLRNYLEGERNALAAADAQRHHATSKTIAPHGVNETGRENGTRCADPVPMRDPAAFDIDDVFWQTELLRDRERHGGEGLVDLDPLDVRQRPSGALE